MAAPWQHRCSTPSAAACGGTTRRGWWGPQHCLGSGGQGTSRQTPITGSTLWERKGERDKTKAGEQRSESSAGRTGQCAPATPGNVEKHDRADCWQRMDREGSPSVTPPRQPSAPKLGAVLGQYWGTHRPSCVLTAGPPCPALTASSPRRGGGGRGIGGSPPPSPAQGGGGGTPMTLPRSRCAPRRRRQLRWY